MELTTKVIAVYDEYATSETTAPPRYSLRSGSSPTGDCASPSPSPTKNSVQELTSKPRKRTRDSNRSKVQDVDLEVEETDTSTNVTSLDYTAMGTDGPEDSSDDSDYESHQGEAESDSEVEDNGELHVTAAELSDAPLSEEEAKMWLQIGSCVNDIVSHHHSDPGQQLLIYKRIGQHLATQIGMPWEDELLPDVDWQEQLPSNRFRFPGREEDTDRSPLAIGISLKHHNILAIDDDHDVSWVHEQQREFMLRAKELSDTAESLKPLKDLEYSNMVKCLFKAFDESGIANLKACVTAWDPEILRNTTTAGKIATAAEQEGDEILKPLLASVSFLFAGNESSKPVKHAVTVVAAYVLTETKNQLLQALQRGNKAIELAIGYKSFSDQAPIHATTETKMRGAVWAYIQKTASLDACTLADSKTFHYTCQMAAATYITVRELGWAIALMMDPSSSRLVGRIGAKRWQYYCQIFRNSMGPALDLTEGIGAYIAAHIVLAQPYNDPPRLTGAKTISDIRIAFQKKVALRNFAEIGFGITAQNILEDDDDDRNTIEDAEQEDNNRDVSSSTSQKLILRGFGLSGLLATRFEQCIRDV